MNQYDCDYCQANGLYRNRACFLNEWPGQESYSFQVPVFNEDNPDHRYPIDYVQKQLDVEGLFEELDKIQSIFPDMPILEMIHTWFMNPREVCPTSLIDPELNYLLEAESACRNYQTLPYGGGLWDQPRVILDAFNVITSERNLYERVKSANAQEKLDKKNKKSKSSSNSQSKGPKGGPLANLGIPS